jgi:isopenicillin N synthase-like dioxygenase
MINIPSVDLADFLSEDPNRKQKFVNEIGKAYSEIGFASVKNHFLSDDLRFQVINLAGQNLGLNEKMRIATLAIADKIKVPANQISLIEANTSNALSNGGEIEQGDFQKYQAFERLLQSTFVELAKMLQIEITYTVKNKPKLGLEQTETVL